MEIIIVLVITIALLCLYQSKIKAVEKAGFEKGQRLMDIERYNSKWARIVWVVVFFGIMAVIKSFIGYSWYGSLISAGISGALSVVVIRILFGKPPQENDE